MGCLNRILKMWPDERFVQGEKNIGSKGRGGSFQVALTTLSSALSVVFKTVPGLLW